jgi:hypothetical protein
MDMVQYMNHLSSQALLAILLAVSACSCLLLSFAQCSNGLLLHAAGINVLSGLSYSANQNPASMSRKMSDLLTHIAPPSPSLVTTK